MMEISETTILYLLLVSNAVLLAAASIAIARFRRQCRRFEQFWDSPTGASLANSAMPEPQPRPQANRHLERRVAELQGAMTALARKEQRPLQKVESNLPIENAVRMARHGASIDELVRSCGLNIGEAQLMRKLHGQTRAAATTH